MSVKQSSLPSYDFKQQLSVDENWFVFSIEEIKKKNKWIQFLSACTVQTLEMKLIIEVRRRAPSLSTSHHIRAAPQHKCRTAVWLSYWLIVCFLKEGEFNQYPHTQLHKIMINCVTALAPRSERFVWFETFAKLKHFIFSLRSRH